MNKLATWLNIDNVVKVLYSNKENWAIVKEIYRQSCQLPTEYVETIRTSVNTFRKIFLVGVIPHRLYLTFKGSKKDSVSPIFTADKKQYEEAQRVR